MWGIVFICVWAFQSLCTDKRSTSHFLCLYFYHPWGWGEWYYMMNEQTPKEIALINAIVHAVERHRDFLQNNNELQVVKISEVAVSNIRCYTTMENKHVIVSHDSIELSDSCSFDIFANIQVKNIDGLEEYPFESNTIFANVNCYYNNACKEYAFKVAILPQLINISRR